MCCVIIASSPFETSATYRSGAVAVRWAPEAIVSTIPTTNPTAMAVIDNAPSRCRIAIRSRYQTAAMPAYLGAAVWIGTASGNGMMPVIVVPPPGADTTETVPPKAPRRSAMLTKPWPW